MAAGLRHVFVYGSLLAPEVVNALLERVPPSAPALVRDFHRHSIKGRLYPAAVPAKDSEVTGKVLFDLTEKELRLLDEFEDIEYFKSVVEPILLEPKPLTVPDISVSAPLKANMYVWNNSDDKDLYGDWDYETWRTEHLSDFLQRYFHVSKPR